jgi:FkbM family methyltransferase
MNIVGCKELRAEANLRFLELNRKTMLGKKKERLLIPEDAVIFKSVLYNGKWEPLESKLLATAINKSKSQNICLIDVGANVGLISRQTLNMIDKKIDICTFEPLPIHNVCLKANLEGHQNLRYLHQSQYALGLNESRTLIYTENENKGNSSLNVDFMDGRNWESQEIIVKSSLDEFNKIMLQFPKSEYFLKVDIQGYELEVLSQVPFTFFDRTNTMIIEVTSSEGINTRTVDKVLESFGSFSNLRFNHPKARKITAEEVATIWKEQSGKQRNLFISRD